MSKNPEATEVAVFRWWRKKDFGYQAIGAFKTGLAVVLCVWLGNLFGLRHSYWAAISAIVVMGVDTTLTFASCRDRIIGTAIGAFMGLAHLLRLARSLPGLWTVGSALHFRL
jgi:uncharacterized membrane protein YccC